MLSEPSKTAARSAKCFPSPRKRLRVPQNAFRALGNSCALREMPSRALGNGCALREMLSEPSETAAHSAKCLQRRLKPPRAPRNAFPSSRKPPRAPRNAFPSSRKPPCALRSPSRILGNSYALREMLSEPSETSARSAITFHKPPGTCLTEAPNGLPPGVAHHST